MGDIEKARSAWGLRSSRRIDTRAKGLAKPLHGWLLRYARMRQRDFEAGRLRPIDVGIKKSATEQRRLQAELFALLRDYGLRHLNEAGSDAAAAAGGEWVLRPELRDQFVEQAAREVVLLQRSTEAAIRESLRTIFGESLKESPRPSRQAIARRIANEWYGTDEDGGKGKDGLFSFERAELIARTELVQVDNQAIAEGFSVSGVDKVKWLARGNDGKSGERKHYLMNSEPPISIQAMRGRDKRKWFRLPDGKRAPYPGHSGLPIKHLANCRCTIVPA